MNQLYKLKDWKVDPTASTITDNSQVLKLDHKVMELLIALIEHQGEIIGREQLLDIVWPNQVIADDVLNVTISTLRKQLGDPARNPEFIKTIARKGYQLIAEVERINQEQKTSPLTAKTSGNQWMVFATLSAVLIAAIIYFNAFNSPKLEEQLEAQLKSQPVNIVETLAVLPFDLYSANKEDEYIADGLTEAIINRLVDIDNLRITSRTSVMTFKKDKPDIKTIAKQLNVKWILEGSIQVENKQLNVTAQLIDTTTDQHQWSETYQRPLNDLFAIQADIASEIAIRFKQDNSQEKASKIVIPPLAYDAYIRGQFHFKNNENVQAVKAYEEAISLYPNYALAYAGLAENEFIKAYMAKDNVPEILEKAGALALKAAEIDDYPARVQLVLATYYTYTIHDYDKAGVAYNNAYTRDSQDVMIQEWYSTYLIITGQFNVGRKMVEHMMSVNPLAYNKLTKYLLLYYAKDYAAATKEVDLKAPFLNESFVQSLYTWTYLAEGNVQGLLRTADKLLANYDMSDADIATYKQLLSTDGIPKAVSYAIDKLPTQFDDYSKAELLAWADRPEEAIELLFPLVISRKLTTIKFATEPAFEKLHNHPKFQQLVQIMGLQDYN